MIADMVAGKAALTALEMLDARMLDWYRRTQAPPLREV